MKQYVALARVSSREQEREEFSLEVQEEALRRYATQNGGEIIKLFRIAETASKRDERTTFKEMIAFAKKRCLELEGCCSTKSTERPGTWSTTWNWNGWNRNTMSRSSRSHNRPTAIPPVG